jgi:hypothetical protein
MNPSPPDEGSPENVDEQYRRASALEYSRPSDAVRQSILAHAQQLAAERANQSGDGRRRAPRIAARQRALWRPAIFGTLAAAGLAALMIAPRYLLTPRAVTREPEPTAAVSEVSQAPAEPAAPAPSAPARDSTPQPQGAPPGASALQSKPARRLEALTESNIAAKANAAPRAAQVPPALAPIAGSTPATADVARADSASAAPSAGAGRSQGATDVNNAFRLAAQMGDLGRLAALREQQTNIDARDSSGRTALMLAVQQGQTQAVAELLDYGADPNVPDFAGMTPLAAALASGQSAVVALLQHHGAR